MAPSRHPDRDLREARYFCYVARVRHEGVQSTASVSGLQEVDCYSVCLAMGRLRFAADRPRLLFVRILLYFAMAALLRYFSKYCQ